MKNLLILTSIYIFFIGLGFSQKPPRGLSPEAKELWNVFFSEKSPMKEVGSWIELSSVNHNGSNSAIDPYLNEKYKNAFSELKRRKEFHELIKQGDYIFRQYHDQKIEEIIAKNKYALNLNLKETLQKSIFEIEKKVLRIEKGERKLTDSEAELRALKEVRKSYYNQKIELGDITSKKAELFFPGIVLSFKKWKSYHLEHTTIPDINYKEVKQGREHWFGKVKRKVSKIKLYNIHQSLPTLLKIYEGEHYFHLVEIKKETKQNKYHLLDIWRFEHFSEKRPDLEVIPLNTQNVKNFRFDYIYKSRSPFGHLRNSFQFRYVTKIKGKEFGLVMQRGTGDSRVETEGFSLPFSRYSFVGRNKEYFDFYMAAKELDYIEKFWDGFKSSYSFHSNDPEEEFKEELIKSFKKVERYHKAYTGSRFEELYGETYRVEKPLYERFMHDKSYLHRIYYWGMGKGGGKKLNRDYWKERDKKADKNQEIQSFLEYFRDGRSYVTRVTDGFFTKPSELLEVKNHPHNQPSGFALLRHSFKNRSVYLRKTNTPEIENSSEYSFPGAIKSRDLQYLKTSLFINPYKLKGYHYISIPTPLGYFLRKLELSERVVDINSDSISESKKTKNYKVFKGARGSFFARVKQNDSYNIYRQYEFYAEFDIDPDFKWGNSKQVILKNQSGLKRMIHELRRIGLFSFGRNIEDLSKERSILLSDLELIQQLNTYYSYWSSNGRFIPRSPLGALAGYVYEGLIAIQCTGSAELSDLLINEVYGNYGRKFSFEKAHFFKVDPHDTDGFVRSEFGHVAMEGIDERGRYFIFDGTGSSEDPRGNPNTNIINQTDSQYARPSKNDDKTDSKVNEDIRKRSYESLKRNSTDFWKKLAALYLKNLKESKIKVETIYPSSRKNDKNLVRDIMDFLRALKLYFDVGEDLFSVYERVSKRDATNVSEREARLIVEAKARSIIESLDGIDKILEEGGDLPIAVHYLSDPKLSNAIRYMGEEILKDLLNAEIGKECPMYLRESDEG